MSAELVSSKGLCPWLVHGWHFSMSVRGLSLGLIPLLLRTPIILNPLIWPLFILINYLKALSPNIVIFWGTDGQDFKIWILGDTIQPITTTQMLTGKKPKKCLIYIKQTNNVKKTKQSKTKTMNGNNLMYNRKPQKWQGEKRSFGAHILENYGISFTLLKAVVLIFQYL